MTDTKDSSTFLARQEYLQEFMTLHGKASDLVVLLQRFKTHPSFGEQMAMSVATDKIETAAQRIRDNSWIFNVSQALSALPQAHDLASLTQENVVSGLVAGAIITNYVAVDQLLNHLLREIPNRFGNDILRRRSETKIKLSDILDLPLEDIRRREIERWLIDHEAKSITEKTKTLYSFVRPPSKVGIPTLDDIEHLRITRHYFAHANGPTLDFADMDRLVLAFNASMLMLSFWVWETIDGKYHLFNIDAIRANDCK